MKKWAIILFLTLLPDTGPATEKPVAGPQRQGFPADYRKANTDPRIGRGIKVIELGARLR